MKKLYLLIILFLCLFIVPMDVKASSDSLQIKEYKVTVNPKVDGSLFMEYYIKLDVIRIPYSDYTIDFDLELPNDKVNGVEIIKNDLGYSPISKISYHSIGGDFLKINLDGFYSSEETVDLKFSLVQSYMYEIDKVNYKFTPRGFNVLSKDIEVDSIKVEWNTRSVISNNALTQDGSFYIWQKENLDNGEELSVELEYDKSFFPNIKENMERSDLLDDSLNTNAGVIIGIISSIVMLGFCTLIVLLIFRYPRSSYEYNRGFSIRHMKKTHFTVHAVNSKGKRISLTKERPQPKERNPKIGFSFDTSSWDDDE